MRCARNEQNVGLDGIARRGQNTFAIDGLLATQTRSLHELQPLLDSAGVFAVAVVIEDAFAPRNTKRGVLAARQNRRVFDGDVRLVVVAIEGPGLQLPARELAFVHQQVERMLVVIALFADGVESGDKFLLAEGDFVLAGFHKEMVRPSWGISRASSGIARGSGESSSRMGFVLLMWMRILRPFASAGNCARNPSAPESGRWPISRAVLSVRPVRSSSSSDQNVPSIRVTSAETASFFHSELSPEREVATKSFLPSCSNKNPSVASSGAAARRNSSLA